jgi:hypothetical protein
MNENALPYVAEVGFRYQAVKSGSTFRNNVTFWVPEPALTANVNSTLVTRRAGAYPVIRTSRPPDVRTATMLVICGGPVATSTEATRTSFGPLSKFAVRRTVPATVPVNKEVDDAKTALLLFAGIVKFTVLDPDENCVMGSSLGFSALGVNESASWPVNGLGWGVDSTRSMPADCVGFKDTGKPDIDNGASAGSTLTVNSREFVLLRLSETVTVKVDIPVAVGVP